MVVLKWSLPWTNPLGTTDGNGRFYGAPTQHVSYSAEETFEDVNNMGTSDCMKHTLG